MTMGWRDQVHHSLAAALGRHHEDPMIQQLAGLRRMGSLVYDLDEEIKAKSTTLGIRAEKDLARARAYYAAAQVLVTFADAFVLDAFIGPDHPKHIPHVTFLQAAQFYQKLPDLVTAVRRELAYPGSATAPLPVLPGPRIEAEGKCPLEHMLAMQRAAKQTEDLLGTRIELLQRSDVDPKRIQTPVLLMTDARTKEASADLVIGALRSGERVPPEVHEEAEGFYYDGVLRSYLYAGQELELPGITRGAPETEDEDDEPAPDPTRVVQFSSGGQRSQAGSFGNMGGGFGGMGGGFGGLGGGGLNWGTLITADVVANLIGDLLGGMFGGGGGGNFW